MQMTVIDGTNAAQIICVDAPTQNFTDISGAIVANAQAVVIAQANTARSGWFLYNPGTTPIYVSDTANAATNNITPGDGSFVVNPGQSISSKQLGYCSTLPLSVFSTAAVSYVARVW